MYSIEEIYDLYDLENTFSNHYSNTIGKKEVTDVHTNAKIKNKTVSHWTDTTI